MAKNMYRIGLLADTHGSQRAFEKALDKMGEIDLLLHAGDFITDALVMADLHEVPMYAVAGNCDLFAQSQEEEKVIKVLDHRILLIHGHRQQVKHGLERLKQKAQEAKADICVFGHTHCITKQTIEGILFLNPGSPIQPRGSRAGCMVLTLLKGAAPQVEVISW